MQSPRVVSTLLRQVRSYHGGKVHYVPPSMNELPVPVGSWQEAHNIKQKKFNAILAAGIGFAAFSIFTAKASGLLYFNYSPPKSLD